jgi:hypothetical protein
MPTWMKMVIECSNAHSLRNEAYYNRSFDAVKRAKIVIVSIKAFITILSKDYSGVEPIK